MNMKNFLPLIVFGAMLGCGAPGPDKKVEQDRLATAQQIRTLYDKAGGDYDRLSAEDKSALLKSFNNDEASARRMWSAMQAGSAGSAANTTPGRAEGP